MNRYGSGEPSNTRDEKQDQPLYCSAFQAPEDILCGGSDTEQTEDEVKMKRQRYEESARRYLSGHVPFLQSASLRGPLHRKSDWINPWRYRPHKANDWWQPGSEDMLFTRENVMRRAAEHGLGYMEPAQALAWCKAAADAEAEDDFDHHDSMEALRSEEPKESSDEDIAEDSPANDDSNLAFYCDNDQDQTEPEPATVQPMDAPCTGEYRINRPIDSTLKGTKRPAESQWLKGSYISKRARWGGRPMSSPTPLPHQQNDRDQRPKHNSTESPPLDNELSTPKPKPVTPWQHESHERRPRSLYSGSTTQGLGSKDIAALPRGSRRQRQEVNEDLERSQGTPLVLARTFSSRSDDTPKRRQLNVRTSVIEPDELMIDSVANVSNHMPFTKISMSTSRKTASPTELPTLPQNPESQMQAQDDSFITEVALSSRDLEKFQYKKKRRKSKKIKEQSDDLEDVHVSTEKPIRSSSCHDFQGPTDDCKECLISAPCDAKLAHHVLLEALIVGGHDEHEESARKLADAAALRATPSEVSIEPTPDEISPERTSSQLDDSYGKEVVMMPDIGLPDFDRNSPFAPFAPFEQMDFGSFGVGNAKSSSSSVLASYPSIKAQDRQAIDKLPAAHTEISPPYCLPTTTQQPASRPSLTVSGPDIKIRAGPLHKFTSPVRSISPDDVEVIESAKLPSQRSQPLSARTIFARPCPGSSDFQTAGASTQRSNIIQIRSASQEFEKSRGVSTFKVLPSSPEKSRGAPKSIQKIIGFTQDTNIDDASTQSYNSTAPKSAQKSHLSPRTPRRTTERNTFSELAVQPSNTSFNKDEASATPIVGPIADVNTASSTTKVQLPEAVDVSLAPVGLKIDTIQQDILQHQDSGTNSSSQIECNLTSQLSTNAAKVEPESGKRTLLASDQDEVTPAADDEQESWAGCSPQSPWAVENILPETYPKKDQPEDAFRIIERINIPGSERSSHSAIEETLDWRTVEELSISNDESITSVVSPKGPRPPDLESTRTEPYASLSSTQLLVAAATRNPWESSPKKCALTKPRKRVSFGFLPSDEGFDSQPTLASSLRESPRSPPPPQSIARDEVDNSPIAVGQFGKHFSKADLRHLIPTGSQVFKSPAVGAMADMFIEADRGTSAERRRHAEPSGTPTRHLRPKSDEHTNRSPSQNTEQDVEIDLDDFINDASKFLQDWSVDSEVKATKAARGGESTKGTPRSLFGLRNVWAS